MKFRTYVFASLLCAASLAQADSPSSIAASEDTNPSTVSDNGGFVFGERDNGKHTGWCTGIGHLAAPGLNASGHRNHKGCDVEDPTYCRNNPDDPACES